VTTKHKTYPKLPLYGLRSRRGVRIEASTRLPGPRSRVTSDACPWTCPAVWRRVPAASLASEGRTDGGGRSGCGLGACGLAALALHCPTCASVDTSLQSTVPSCTASCPLRHNWRGPPPRARVPTSVDVCATSRVASSIPDQRSSRQQESQIGASPSTRIRITLATGNRNVPEPNGGCS
jgi:hypothetical protein